MAIPWVGNEFDQVRWAIDASLDDDSLSSQVIRSPLYGGAAEDEIEAQLATTYESLTTTQQRRVRRARVLLTAALLCPAIPQITGEQTPEFKYTRQAIDWTARAADLRQRADGELATVIAPTETTPNRPTLFGTAAGYRGR